MKAFVDDEIVQTIDTGTTFFANVAGEAEGLEDVTTLTSCCLQFSSFNRRECFLYCQLFCICVSTNIVLDKYESSLRIVLVSQ